MKFINRRKELTYLEDTRQLSKRKLFTLVVFGLRRVGKTRLIKEFTKGKSLYFFVNKNKSSIGLLRDFQEVLRENKLISELEILRNWDDFFKIIFERYKGIVVFDEFQNFFNVDPSVFGTLQNFIDGYEERKDLLIVFCGSLIGLIKRTFEDNREPLYGRIKRKLNLKPLSLLDIMEMGDLLKLDFEDIIKLYVIFGGFPLYWVAIEDEGLVGKGFEEIMESFFFRENAIFEDEVEKILALEFGKRKGRYYDILVAIASGRNTLAKIASFLSVKQTELTRYVKELVEYFEMVEYEKQVCGNKRIMYIKNSLMNFWFRHFYKNLSLYKQRNPEFIKKTKENISSYIGKRFELICAEIIKELKLFDADSVGKQWGKIKGKPKGENTYEIDVLAINEKTKEILACECKWQGRVNAEKVVKELNEKLSYVDWHKKKRKESFAIFAKSFSKKIKSYEGKPVYCFDLKDLQRLLRKR